MIAAFLSEFRSMRSTLIQILLITIAVSLVMGIFNQSPSMASGACSAMLPMFAFTTFFSYDMMNGWERYRALMPLSRRDIVGGRYLNVAAVALAGCLTGILISLVCLLLANLGIGPDWLIAQMDEMPLAAVLGVNVLGTCIVLVLMAVCLPFILKYGFTKASRYLLVGMFILFLMVPLVAQGANADMGWLEGFGAWIEANYAIAAAIAVAVAAGSYIGSFFLATALYKSKEL